MQRGDGELQGNADKHGDDELDASDTIGRVPELWVGARAPIAKSIDGIGSDPAKDKREGVENGNNRNAEKNEHREPTKKRSITNEKATRQQGGLFF